MLEVITLPRYSSCTKLKQINQCIIKMAALLSIPLRTARTDDDSFSRFFSEPFKIKAQNTRIRVELIKYARNSLKLRSFR